jgi:hypothetical protein
MTFYLNVKKLKKEGEEEEEGGKKGYINFLFLP